jgi:hypothetical protein
MEAADEKRNLIASFRVTKKEMSAIDKACKLKRCSRNVLLWRAVFLGEATGPIKPA